MAMVSMKSSQIRELQRQWQLVFSCLILCFFPPLSQLGRKAPSVVATVDKTEASINVEKPENVGK